MFISAFNHKYYISSQKNLKIISILYLFIVDSNYFNYRLKKNNLESLLNTEYHYTTFDCSKILQFNKSDKAMVVILNSSKFKYYNYLLESKRSILGSLKLIGEGYSFISCFMQKFFSVNRLNSLSNSLYMTNYRKKFMLVNRKIIDYRDKNLITHIRKYLKRQKVIKLRSYWQYPINVKYSVVEKTYFINYRNSFNRVLVNNLINLFCSKYLRIFFNIFRHFNRLISKKIMSFYLHDYNFFKLFTRKKYTKFTLQ